MPKSNEAFQQIEKHRNQIDELDKQIVDLLNKRAGHSLVIRGLKPEAKMDTRPDTANTAATR